jgi:hypothetical protein
MRRLVVALVFLLLPAFSDAAPTPRLPDGASRETVLSWINGYRRNPDPDRVPAGDPGGKTLFLDVETQRSADDVGGWGFASKMGLALAVAVGWRRRRIVLMILCESTALSLVGGALGVGVDGTSHTVYVANSSSNEVDAFGDARPIDERR